MPLWSSRWQQRSGFVVLVDVKECGFRPIRDELKLVVINLTRKHLVVEGNEIISHPASAALTKNLGNTHTHTRVRESK